MFNNLQTTVIPVQKRHALRISRGTNSGSHNVFVKVEYQGYHGIGEAAPGTTSHNNKTAATATIQAIDEFVNAGGLKPTSIHDIWQAGIEHDLAPPAMAAIDMALWDATAQAAKMPLYRLLGLSNKQVATSLTVGINPPDVIAELVPEILERTGAKFLKLKLGSPEGMESDQVSFTSAMLAAEPYGAKIRVDANGGWDLPTAKQMLTWLANRGVDHVEQPLAQGNEAQLPELFKQRPLPIYVDESVHFAKDIPALAECVDGINLKLMKCGGITEALRMVATARALGLKTMMGCMGETSVSISAAAHISCLFDHLDLDSHLNLHPDPATGATLEDGHIVPPSSFGTGVTLNDANW